MKVATKTLLMITAITLILALPAMAASSPAPAKSRVHAKVAPAPAPAEEHPQIRAVWRPYATRKNNLNTLPTILEGIAWKRSMQSTRRSGNRRSA